MVLKALKCLSILLFCFFSIHKSFAQVEDTEFKKGWLGVLKITNGIITNFKGNFPDLYAGGVSLNPQVTAVEHKLRVGINAGFIYSGKKMWGLAGPMVAYKIKNFDVRNLGGLANMYVTAEANWGTDNQQLAGLGVMLEALQKIHLGFSVQRDYNLNYWFFQSHIGIPIIKSKEKKSIFDE